MNIINPNNILPTEITKCCDTGIEHASFDYYSGIKLAKANNWEQTTSIGKLQYEKSFVVCCGDVMIEVKPDDFTDITRRIF